MRCCIALHSNSLIGEAQEQGLTFHCSGVLQNRGSGRAGQFRAEDLRRCHGKSHAQEDEDGKAAGAYDFDGQSYDGGPGECSEGCAGAAFPSGGRDAEESE